MPSINNSRPILSTPSSETGAVGATPGNKPNNQGATSSPGHDQFDASQAATPFQQRIDQEILPDNRGELAHGAHKQPHGTKADDAQDPLDPANLLAQAGAIPKA